MHTYTQKECPWSPGAGRGGGWGGTARGHRVSFWADGRLWSWRWWWRVVNVLSAAGRGPRRRRAPCPVGLFHCLHARPFAFQPPHRSPHRPSGQGPRGPLQPGDGCEPSVCGSRRERPGEPGSAERPGAHLVRTQGPQAPCPHAGTTGNPGAAGGGSTSSPPLRDAERAASWTKMGLCVCVCVCERCGGVRG